MKRKAYPSLLAAAILVSFLGNSALGQQTETLADVLAHNSIATTDAAPIPRLHSRVTSYDVLNDAQEFVIGYYLAHEDNQLDFPLFLSRLDKHGAFRFDASRATLALRFGWSALRAHLSAG